MLCLTISSGVSGTYASALTAADTFTALPVQVVDTRSLTMGQGLMVIAAAEEAAAGADLDALVAATEPGRPGSTSTACWAGSITSSGAAASAGPRRCWARCFNIKPVIQVKDGVVAEESKQRTRARALGYLTAKVAGDAPLERLAVADGACDDFDEVSRALGKIPVAHPLVSVQLGPVVGAHAGPNTVGVCYITGGRS